MKWLVLMTLIPLLAWGGQNLQPPPSGEPSYCPDCHQKEHAEYIQSRMAYAARTPTFLYEWKTKGKAEHCLDCHAPSRKDGITCIDCHGSTGHPYLKLDVPEVCARCHDAPGENTVRSFRSSPAARRGEGCLDCHLEGDRVSHDFKGPSSSGFLEGVAKLRIALRRDVGGYTALIRIRHRAGHALPGGTTGRSVWLVVEEVNAENVVRHQKQYRFGWVHDPQAGWEENTLPPGAGKVIEVPRVNPEETRFLRAKLIYRFIPGNLEKYDPDQVVLDMTEYVLTSSVTK